MTYENLNWSQEEAIALCRALESFAPEFGAHVALTGGCLYRDGERKDVDILVYRIRQIERIDWAGFFDQCASQIGIIFHNDYGWCKKASLADKRIDFFDAESDGEYGAYSTVDFEAVQS